MTTKAWDTSAPPIYGCLTGIELPNEMIAILPGIALRRVYVDTFGATMMAFAPPSTPKSPHPTPWAAVCGGFNFEGRVEVELTDMSLRRIDPVSGCLARRRGSSATHTDADRLAVIGNMPFDRMGEHWQEVQAVAFESAPHQIGIFTAMRIEVTNDELSWLRDMFPVAARLYHDERFFRAFSVYDQAQWTPRWKWRRNWFGRPSRFCLISPVNEKRRRAICRTLSDYVGVDQSDRDRAYQVIQYLYYKRGQTVHAGRRTASQDVIQSFRLASVAFQRVLINGVLPLFRGEPAH